MSEMQPTDATPAPVATYPGQGRPTQLTQALAERIADYVGEGLHPDTAARRCGVARQTFQRWEAKGRHDDETGVCSIYAYLWACIDQKDAECEGRWVSDAASGRMGWQGPMTAASRRYTRWREQADSGRGQVVVIVGKGANANVQINGAGETQRAIADGDGLSPLLTGDMHRLTADSGGAKLNIKPLISREDSGQNPPQAEGG